MESNQKECRARRLRSALLGVVAGAGIGLAMVWVCFFVASFDASWSCQQVRNWAIWILTGGLIVWYVASGIKERKNPAVVAAYIMSVATLYICIWLLRPVRAFETAGAERVYQTAAGYRNRVMGRVFGESVEVFGIGELEDGERVFVGIDNDDLDVDTFPASKVQLYDMDFKLIREIDVPEYASGRQNRKEWNNAHVVCCIEKAGVGNLTGVR